MSDSKDNRYDVSIIASIWNFEEYYGCFVMDIVILAIAIYAIFRKRWQRFEVTIILCMFLKYALYTIGNTEMYSNFANYGPNWRLLYACKTLMGALGPITHWIYAS